MGWENALGILVPLELDVTKDINLDMHGTVQAGKMAKNITNSFYEIQRQLFARSERVKGIDFHPVEPWILTTLYSGMFFGAWNIRAHADVYAFQVMSTYGRMKLKYAIKSSDLT